MVLIFKNIKSLDATNKAPYFFEIRNIHDGEEVGKLSINFT
jgi:hypothetical protein